ncbi:hypothetical protein GCM10027516_19570 [Niabella aquatica]
MIITIMIQANDVGATIIEVNYPDPVKALNQAIFELKKVDKNRKYETNKNRRPQSRRTK